MGTVDVVLTVVEDDVEPEGVIGAAAGCDCGGVEPSLPGGTMAGACSPVTAVRGSMIGLLGSIIVKCFLDYTCYVGTCL